MNKNSNHNRLLAHVLGVSLSDVWLGWELSSDQQARFDVLNARLLQGEPIDYVVGEVPFGKAMIRVDRRALIPRVETELLLDIIAKKRGARRVVWDLCTGSGCIGIALKLSHIDLCVTISDICPEALSLAKENVDRHGVA
ncbi:MAG: peptide chain release factor N(5)-glutamine methyltransferase, partial [Chlamydiota bacterium]